jgi:hypothetical protein
MMIRISDGGTDSTEERPDIRDSLDWDMLLYSMEPFLIGMFDDEDTPRKVLRMAFALASERPIVKFVSQGSSEENLDIQFGCTGLSPETFPLIGGAISSLIGVFWTTPITVWDNTMYRGSKVRMYELRGRSIGGERWTFTPLEVVCGTHAEWIPNVSVTLKVQSSTWCRAVEELYW